MKISHVGFIGLAVLVTGFCAASPALAQRAGNLGVGARYHIDHSVFTDLPFGNGDIGYGPVYEYHDANALWQIGATYVDTPGTDKTISKAVTPELNLIYKEGVWRGGLGALATYIKPEEGDTDWTDVYWQFLLGLGTPIGKMIRGCSLSAYAVYPFEKWSALDEFEGGDIEFSAWLTYDF